MVHANISQDNLTHWLISTQVTHHKEQPSVGAFGSYEPAASPAPTRSPPPHYGAQPTPAADPFTDPYDVAEAKAEDLYVEGCVEINLNRRDRTPARHRRDACSMAWRCLFTSDLRARSVSDAVAVMA